MTAQTFSNNGQTTLTAPVLTGDTSISVASALTFPAAVPYTILIDQEYMLVTAGAGSTTWGVTRGVEGSLAAPHAAGPAPNGDDTVFQDFTLGGLQSLNDGFWPFLSPSGLTGATQPSRYVGATVTGPPGSGSFVVGDWAIDRSGGLWGCVSAGSPGTWRSLRGAGIWNFRAYRKTTYALPGGAATTIPFDTAGDAYSYDPAAGFDTGAHAYTIPTGAGGKWHFDAQLKFAVTNVTGAADMTLVLNKNAAGYAFGGSAYLPVASTVFYPTAVVSADIAVNAGDVITAVGVWLGSPAQSLQLDPNGTAGPGGQSNYFSGHFVSSS